MKRMSTGEVILNGFFYVILALLIVICVYPIWYVIVASVSDGTYVNSGALILLPVNMKFTAYEYAFSQKQLWVGYGNTILYTLGGTLFGLAISLPCGYALSRRDMEGRGLIMGLITFTMYFNGGLIPTYIVCSALHLTNTRLLLIFLGSVTAYNIILIRTFCSSSIPDELREAAFIGRAAPIPVSSSCLSFPCPMQLSPLFRFISPWRIGTTTTTPWYTPPMRRCNPCNCTCATYY